MPARKAQQGLPRWRHLVAALFCAGAFSLPCDLLAQAAQDGADAPLEEAEASPDPLGRDTPRGTFSGYIDAVSAANYERAAEYLDLSYLPADQQAARGPDLARNLQATLDQRSNIPPALMLSDRPQGREDDGLEFNQDRVGTVQIDGNTLTVLVERQEESGLWLFSAETIAALPAHAGPQGFSIDQVLPEPLTRTTLRGVPVGHWIAILLLAVLAYIATRIITFLVFSIARETLGRRGPDYGFELVNAFELPLRIFLAVVLFALSSQLLSISIVVRQYFGQAVVIVFWLALLILGWRLVTAMGQVAEKRMSRTGNLGALSAVLFFRRSAKFTLAAVGIILILDVLGFDVTTGLAALGIGGLAVALGAQRSIENLVGSLNLIFDQPVRVGDFCRVGETVGTVEQIGMRSTRIRTTNRTMVVIPNGDFASQTIENFAHRDRFLFHPVLGLRYETSPDQLRFVLVELRRILYAHPRVDPAPARVRFIGLGESALNVELFAFIRAKDFDDYLEVQEDLYLRFVEVVDQSGTGFAFPSQTLYMARDQGLDAEKRAEAEVKVRQMREQDELPLPHFDRDQISRLRRKIVYPPEGSSKGPRP